MAIIKKTPIVSEIIEKWYEIQDIMTYLLPLLNDFGTDVQYFRDELDLWICSVKDYLATSLPTCKDCFHPISFEGQVCSHKDFNSPCDPIDIDQYESSYFEQKDKLDIIRNERALHKQRLLQQKQQIAQIQANIDQVFENLIGKDENSK